MHPPDGSSISAHRSEGEEAGFEAQNAEALGCRKDGDVEGEQKAFASLLVSARVAGHDTWTGEALGGLGSVLIRRNEYEAARAVLLEAVALWERLGDERRVAGAECMLGVALQYGSDHGTAFVHLRRALDQFRALADLHGIARCTSWLGVVSSRLSDYEAAMDYHLETLRIGEELDKDHIRAIALNSLGLVHWKLGDPDEARRCFERALECRRNVEDPEGEADTLSNLGLLSEEGGDPQGALEYYFRSLEVRGASTLNPNRANTLQNIGNAYVALGEPERSLEYHLQALEIREALGGVEPTGSYQNLGALYLETGRQDEAAEYLDRALELARSFDLKDDERMILELQAKCGERAGDLETALAKQREALDLQRLIFREETSRRVAEMRARFEAERMEKEGEIFRLKNVELVEANQKLEAALKTARDHARSDPLTGLANRREMLERIQDEVDRFKRYARMFSVVLFDLDGFKRVNDVHGHDVGDAMILAVADLLRSETRIEDRVGRWGGDEFLAILPETDGEGAVIFAERMRVLIEEQVLECVGERIGITVSAGVSRYHGTDSISAVVKRADEALYQSKKAGRNRVTMGGSP